VWLFLAMPSHTGADIAKLIELARSGDVIFQSHLPSDIPGWGNLAQRRVEFKKLTDQIHLAYVGERIQEAKVGRGKILVGDGEAALCRAAIAREAMTDHAGMYFVRRKISDGWNYFIANRLGTAFEGWVTLGRPARSITIMDPLTGKVGAAATDVSKENASVFAIAARWLDHTSRLCRPTRQRNNVELLADRWIND
jgi:hypothetical protein